MPKKRFRSKKHDPDCWSVATLVPDSQSIRNGPSPNINEESTASSSADNANNVSTMIIESREALSVSQKEHLASLGVQFMGVLGNNKWSCQIDPQDLPFVRRLSYVKISEGPPPPPYKSPPGGQVPKAPSKPKRGLTLDITLRDSSNEANSETIRRIIEQFGIPAESISTGKDRKTIRMIDIHPGKYLGVAMLDNVAGVKDAGDEPPLESNVTKDGDVIEVPQLETKLHHPKDEKMKMKMELVRKSSLTSLASTLYTQ